MKELKNVPYDESDAQRKYELWRLKQTVSISLHAQPKQVIERNKQLHHEELTVEEVRSYLAEITQFV